MFNIGGSELLLILLAALLLLGPARIPGFVRSAARWYREFMKMKEQVDASLSEIREEIEKEGQPVKQLATELEGIRRHALPEVPDSDKAAAEAQSADKPSALQPAQAEAPEAEPEGAGKPNGAAALIRPPEGRTLAHGSLGAAQTNPAAPVDPDGSGERP